MGIEPTRPAWKAGILPLNYTRISAVCTLKQAARLILAADLIYYSRLMCVCQAFFRNFFKKFLRICVNAYSGQQYRYFIKAMIQYTIPAMTDDTVPKTITGPAIVNIFAPTPRI